MKNSNSYGCLCVSSLCILCDSGVRSPAAEKPNIVFILADDLGYGDLGCYGQELIRTPKIDRMAAQGMRFTQCYAGSTVCAPSRCTLMTGYAHRPLHRSRQRHRAAAAGGPHRRRGPARTPATRPALIGKWGLGEAEIDRRSEQKRLRLFLSAFSIRLTRITIIPDFLWRNGEKAPIPGERAVENSRRRGEAGRVCAGPVRARRPSTLSNSTRTVRFSFTSPHGARTPTTSGPRPRATATKSPTSGHTPTAIGRRPRRTRPR